MSSLVGSKQSGYGSGEGGNLFIMESDGRLSYTRNEAEDRTYEFYVTPGKLLDSCVSARYLHMLASVLTSPRKL
jgi:hypothetical protein